MSTPADQDPPAGRTPLLIELEAAHERVDRLLDRMEALSPEARAAHWPTARHDLRRQLTARDALLPGAPPGATLGPPHADPLDPAHRGEIDRLLALIDQQAARGSLPAATFEALRDLLAAAFRDSERRVGARPRPRPFTR